MDTTSTAVRPASSPPETLVPAGSRRRVGRQTNPEDRLRAATVGQQVM